MDSETKQTKQLSIVFSHKEKELLDDASEFCSLNVTSFVRNSAIMEARRLLKFSVEKQNHPLYLEQQPHYDNRITHQGEVH